MSSTLLHLKLIEEVTWTSIVGMETQVPQLKIADPWRRYFYVDSMD